MQHALIKQSRLVGQGNRQGTEVGRARKKTGHGNRQGKQIGRGSRQGKEKERQPARQGNKAVGEKDRWIICFAA